jgi:hypothetical protein
MNVVTFDPVTVQDGVQAFRDATRQYLGSVKNCRQGGVRVIPGAIAAAVRAGIFDEDEISRMVARVCRCPEANVSTILHALAEEHVAGRLWTRGPADGTFFPKGSLARVPATFIAY